MVLVVFVVVVNPGNCGIVKVCVASLVA
jgi:hypothetical protein